MGALDSIIDVLTIVTVDFEGEEYGMVRPLSDDEYVAVFGMAQPGRTEHEQAVESGELQEQLTGGRWTGRAAVLWADGAPAEIAFWGYSAD